MGENINDSYYDSEDKLTNSSNEASEGVPDTDMRRRFMKMGTYVDYIVQDGRISDLGGEKLLNARSITLTIEENLDKILEILNIDKSEILKNSSEQISYLLEDIKGQVGDLLPRNENI